MRKSAFQGPRREGGEEAIEEGRGCEREKEKNIKSSSYLKRQNIFWMMIVSLTEIKRKKKKEMIKVGTSHARKRGREMKAEREKEGEIER